MANTVSEGKLVSFHFTMYSMQGDVLGGSEGQPPLTYIHGHTPIEPLGLAKYLAGQEEGHDGEVVLAPEDAYGERLLPPEESVDSIPKAHFGDNEVFPGMMFMAEIGGKGELPITVMDIKEDQVIVHYGHPLAGQSLRFHIQVVEVREPTDQEKQRLIPADSMGA